MFAKLTRAALAGLLATTALSACAQAPAPRVEYRDFGQGRIAVAIPTTNDAAPYALTGRRNDANWNNQNVRVVDVGQGRIVVPANP